MKEGRAEQIAFVGGLDDIRIGIEAVKRAAVDFLLRPLRYDELVSAVAQALAYSAVVAESRARLARLTPRGFEVFRLLITGSIDKQISDKFGATIRTVKAHRTCVMRKTAVFSVVELVRLALAAGVARPPSLGTLRCPLAIAFQLIDRCNRNAIYEKVACRRNNHARNSR
jgi:two-component system, LuxR family, response regulator FixJ